MRKYLAYAAETRTLWLTFAGTLIFLILVFPALPIGGEMLDLKPSYSHSEAMAALEGYGTEGRMVYAWSSAVLDTLFPLVYVTFFAGLIYRFRPVERAWILSLIPISAGIVDLGENIQIIAMLIQYPEVGETQAAWASTFTMVKGMLGPVYLLLGIALVLLGLAKRLRARMR